MASPKQGFHKLQRKRGVGRLGMTGGQGLGPVHVAPRVVPGLRQSETGAGATGWAN